MPIEFSGINTGTENLHQDSAAPSAPRTSRSKSLHKSPLLTLSQRRKSEPNLDEDLSRLATEGIAENSPPGNSPTLLPLTLQSKLTLDKHKDLHLFHVIHDLLTIISQAQFKNKPFRELSEKIISLRDKLNNFLKLTYSRKFNLQANYVKLLGIINLTWFLIQKYNEYSNYKNALNSVSLTREQHDTRLDDLLKTINIFRSRLKNAIHSYLEYIDKLSIEPISNTSIELESNHLKILFEDLTSESIAIYIETDFNDSPSTNVTSTTEGADMYGDTTVEVNPRTQEGAGLDLPGTPNPESAPAETAHATADDPTKLILPLPNSDELAIFKNDFDNYTNYKKTSTYIIARLKNVTLKGTFEKDIAKEETEIEEHYKTSLTTINTNVLNSNNEGELKLLLDNLGKLLYQYKNQNNPEINDLQSIFDYYSQKLKYLKRCTQLREHLNKCRNVRDPNENFYIPSTVYNVKRIMRRAIHAYTTEIEKIEGSQISTAERSARLVHAQNKLDVHIDWYKSVTLVSDETEKNTDGGEGGDGKAYRDIQQKVKLLEQIVSEQETKVEKHFTQNPLFWVALALGLVPATLFCASAIIGFTAAITGIAALVYLIAVAAFVANLITYCRSGYRTTSVHMGNLKEEFASDGFLNSNIKKFSIFNWKFFQDSFIYSDDDEEIEHSKFEKWSDNLLAIAYATVFTVLLCVGGLGPWGIILWPFSFMLVKRFLFDMRTNKLFDRMEDTLKGNNKNPTTNIWKRGLFRGLFGALVFLLAACGAALGCSALTKILGLTAFSLIGIGLPAGILFGSIIIPLALAVFVFYLPLEKDLKNGLLSALLLIALASTILLMVFTPVGWSALGIIAIAGISILAGLAAMVAFQMLCNTSMDFFSGFEKLRVELKLLFTYSWQSTIVSTLLIPLAIIATVGLIVGNAIYNGWLWADKASEVMPSLTLVFLTAPFIFIGGAFFSTILSLGSYPSLIKDCIFKPINDSIKKGGSFWNKFFGASPEKPAASAPSTPAYTSSSTKADPKTKTDTAAKAVSSPEISSTPNPPIKIEAPLPRHPLAKLLFGAPEPAASAAPVAS